MANAEIKKLIKDSRYYNYEIAERIGVSEYTFSKWFRKQLTQKQNEMVVKAINELKGGCVDAKQYS
jgi:hypothetical protein